MQRVYHKTMHAAARNVHDWATVPHRCLCGPTPEDQCNGKRAICQPVESSANIWASVRWFESVAALQVQCRERIIQTSASPPIWPAVKLQASPQHGVLLPSGDHHSDFTHLARSDVVSLLRCCPRQLLKDCVVDLMPVLLRRKATHTHGNHVVAWLASPKEELHSAQSAFSCVTSPRHGIGCPARSASSPGPHSRPSCLLEG